LRSSTTKPSSIGPGSPDMGIPSPGMESVASFDGKVINEHRESRQAEMDRLYAAVMVHEEAKRSTARISQVQSLRSQKSDDGIQASPPFQASPPKSITDKRKLRVQISETNPTEIPPSPIAPKSPYRAIYPPYPSPGANSATECQSPMTPITPRSVHRFEPPSHDMYPLPSPTSPKRIELPNDMYPASPPPQQVTMQLPPMSTEQPPPPPRSFGRQSMTSSSAGSGRSRKLTLKKLHIGGPSQPGNNDADEREPLSPRFYNPSEPPSPPEPQQYGVRFQDPQTAASVESDAYAAECLDQPKPLPVEQPQRRPNLTLSLPATPGAHKSASASAPVLTNALPLRAFQNASSENMAPSSNPLSPGPIKTTFLERKVERLGRGPLTARTPRTGVPQTPYSAYMPFTPVTPVTPGLVSRRERKERIKAEGRKVLVEEDEVKDAEEMWDGGY